MKKLQDFFAKLDKPRILDVGTGSGNFIKIITSVTDNFTEIVGIDSLEFAVETAKKNFNDERIHFKKMDALEMTFADDTFDMVCLSNSLHHLRDVSGMLKEMERVLKPNGILFINEMVCDGLTERQKTHLLIHHFAAETDRELGDTHNDTFTAVEIRNILENNSSRSISEYWNLEFDTPSENTQEEIDWLSKTLDRLVSRIKDDTKVKYYEEKASQIKEHLNRVGFDSATQQVVILK